MTETQSNEQQSQNGAEYSKEKAALILKQVEYYFGDINLPRDKFLLNEMKAKDGWVPLTTMLKFNRLAKISEDVNELAEALKDSNLIEVNKENNCIRRSIEHPLPDNTLEYWLEVKRRTVYLKGFPQTATIDDVLAYMHQHGNVVNVLMRKTKNEPRVFKGSVFATFATAEEAEKFANDGQEVSYNGQPLIKLMQETYWTNKAKEIKEKKQEAKLLKQAKQNQVDKEQKESIEAAHFVKGIVLKVKGFPLNCQFKELKDFFRTFGDVAYVKPATEEAEAFVRFNSTEENAAQTSWDKAKAAREDGKVIFVKDDKEYELTASVLDGDEESEYWVEFNNQKCRSKTPHNYGKKQRNNKSHQNSRKRQNSPTSNDVDEKKPKRIVFEQEENNDNGNENSENNGETETAA